MGVIKHFSTGKTSSNYMEERVSPYDPNPGKFEIIKHFEDKGHTAVWVNYPNCINYEGNKILVFRDIPFSRISQFPEIDPHFNDKDAKSPFARFEPTTLGWETACYLVSSLKQETYYTGITLLDKGIMGFKRGSLNIIVSRAFTGKTTLLCGFMAKQHMDGLNTLFMRSDDSIYTIGARINSYVSGVPVKDYFNPEFSEQVLATTDTEKNPHLGRWYIHEINKRNLERIGEFIEEYKLDMIFIDSVDFTLEFISMEKLIRIASTYNIPVIISAQANHRLHENKGLDVLVGSKRSLLYSATNVIIWTRTQEEAENNTGTMDVLKARYGYPNGGPFSITFDPMNMVIKDFNE